MDFESCKALESLNKFERICPKVMANRQKTIPKHLVSSRDDSLDIFQYIVCVFLSTATYEVPQATGGNPAAEGAPQPEGRAHHTAGAGD